MRITRQFGFAVLLFLASLSVSPRSNAQSPIDPGQLPGRTIFYVFWHGAPSGEIRKNNSLYALWDDPEFSAGRASFIDTFLENTNKSKENPAPNREELAQYATLLDNAFLIGYLRRPEAPASAKNAAAKEAHPWNGLYLIYDRTGKEELLS